MTDASDNQLDNDSRFSRPSSTIEHRTRENVTPRQRTVNELVVFVGNLNNSHGHKTAVCWTFK